MSPASHGLSQARKACKECRKSKVGCSFVLDNARLREAVRGDTRECTRCKRLNKVCEAPDSQPRAPPVSRTRLGQLEQELEALRQAVQQNHDVPRNPLPDAPPRPNRPRSAVPEHVAETVAQKESTPALLSPPSSLASAELPAADASAWPNDAQADELRTLYTKTIADSFPFVVLPQLPTAQFRQSRPFLFKAMIMVASYRNRELQKRRARDFMSSVANCVLLEGYKSFDVLQGLLVHIAWHQCHVKRNSQITNLLQLAIAVLADLELNKPVHSNDRRKMIYDAARSSFGFTDETRDLSNEERRALLGCYFLSSIASVVYRKVDGIEFSSHMENALEDLLCSREREEDILLSYLVQQQRIVHDISRTIPYDEPQRLRSSGAPFIMHVKMFDKRLDDFHATWPASLRENEFLRMHLSTARIFLYEVSLYDAAWDDSPHQRIDALWSCVESLRSFFSTFRSIRKDSYITMPYTVWGQLSHALLTCSRVTLVEFDGWDASQLDDDVGFLATLDVLTERFVAAQNHAKRLWLGKADDTILNRVITRFTWVRSWFEKYTAERHAMPRSTRCTETTDAVTPRNRDSVPAVTDDIQGVPLMDGRFWESILEDWQAMPLAAMPEHVNFHV